MIYEIEKDRSNSDQIASMINKYNGWRHKFHWHDILHNNARYFAVKNESNIVACAGLSNDSPALSKIQHVCVLPQFRGLGIAKGILMHIVTNICSSDVYMTIREDNISSLYMAGKVGFAFERKIWSIDHWIYVVYMERSSSIGTKVYVH